MGRGTGQQDTHTHAAARPSGGQPTVSELQAQLAKLQAEYDKTCDGYWSWKDRAKDAEGKIESISSLLDSAQNNALPEIVYERYRRECYRNVGLTSHESPEILEHARRASAEEPAQPAPAAFRAAATLVRTHACADAERFLNRPASGKQHDQTDQLTRDIINAWRSDELDPAEANRQIAEHFDYLLSSRPERRARFHPNIDAEFVDLREDDEVAETVTRAYENAQAQGDDPVAAALKAGFVQIEAWAADVINH
jgi:hypothetical protein